MEKSKTIKKLKVYAGLVLLVTSLANLKVDSAEAKTINGTMRTYTNESGSFDIKDYEVVMHRVEKKETIFSIAEDYGVSVQSIINNNSFKSGSGYSLYEGEEILIKQTLDYNKNDSDLSVYNESKPKLKFFIDAKGKAYVEFTKEFAKEKDSFKNEKTSKKLKTGRYYEIEGLVGKTVDVTNKPVKGRIDDYIFIQSDGTLQLLDIDKIYNEGAVIATPTVPNYDKCMYFQQTNAYVEGKKRDVKVITNSGEKSVPSYKDFKKVFKEYEATLAKTYKDLNIDTLGSSYLEFGITKSGKAVVKMNGYTHTIQGLAGKVIDIANLPTTNVNRIDDYYFLLDNGEVQMLDLGILYDEGIFSATSPLEGYDNAKQFLISKSNINGVIKNEYVYVLRDNESKLVPTFENYKPKKDNKYLQLEKIVNKR